MNSETAKLSSDSINSILSFVALDIETTGLDAMRDEIIQIAAVRFVEGEERETFSSFVRNRSKLPIYIQSLTHISPSDLADAPTIDELLPKLKTFVGDSIIVGHNIAFDMGFIDAKMVRTGAFPLPNPRWDTLEVSKVYLPFCNDHKLTTLCRYFGIELENAHRADADATATGHLMCKLSHYVSDHFHLTMNARIYDLARQAKLDDTLVHFMKSFVDHQRSYALLSEKPKTPHNDLVNVIEHHIPSAGIENLESVFGEGGIFSHRFDNYEFRSGQLEMAKQIWEAFGAENHLAVEAGTGVGKSFAYLVPSMQYAFQKNSKVLISTNTKNLQEQLFFKDIPALRKILPIPFKASLVKGRDNYICQRRWDEVLSEQQKGYTDYEAHGLIYLIVWYQLTKTGDVSENSSFDRTRFSYLWRRVNSDRYLCSNRKCPFFKNCFVMRLRKDIEDSSIVVTNHSLLLADMQNENSTMGEFSYLVVDEAHNLMSSAARHLGFEFSQTELNSLLNQLGSSHRRRHSGYLEQLATTMKKSLATDAQKVQIDTLVKSAQDRIEKLKQPITHIFSLASNMVIQADSFGKLRIKKSEDFATISKFVVELAEAWKMILKDLTAISNVLSSLKSSVVPQYDQLTETISSFVMRMLETEAQILTLINPDYEDYALWLETAPKPERGSQNCTICYAPIEVGEHLTRLLYDRVSSIVFTSATLALRGSFRYFLNQSGLNLLKKGKLVESIVDSPFDFDNQAKLLIASFLPEPKDKFFSNQALGCLEQIVSSNELGTMVLFTSYKDLDAVYSHLSEDLFRLNRPFFAQGKGASRTSILNEFKQIDNAVLLGTNSFWEGVDVQGKSLSLLILYKIPFMVPSEPIVEAFIDKLERDDKDSFMHYMLPNALLKLRQGFGRLIRSKSDNGIVLIMDSRVSRKKYGTYFKEVLPCRSIELSNEQQLLNEIGSFFRKRNT